MSLFEKLTEDIKSSMKSGDKLKTETLRFLMADIKNRRISLKRDLEDTEIVETTASQIKKRRESVEEFIKGSRTDLAEKTQSEINILQIYLPPQLTREEIEKLVRDVVAETGAQGQRDMGKVMGQLKSLVRGKADNRLVSEIVKENLK